MGTKETDFNNMDSHSSTCISEVTSAISRMKMGNKFGKKDSSIEPDEQYDTSSSHSPDVPVHGMPDNQMTDSFRLTMMNSDVHSALGKSDQASILPGIRIPIVGYEVMEERARFTVYKLRIENISSGDCWFVFRRYTDFVRLHSKLKNDFPNVRLLLPRKRWFGDNFDPNFLSERIKGLQGFVNGILEHQELHDSPAINDFFCLDEPPSYAESMEESRPIFEALEETIYHLRNQLKEKEGELRNLRINLDTKVKKIHSLIQTVRETTEQCSSCSQILPTLDEQIITSTPIKNTDTCVAASTNEH